METIDRQANVELDSTNNHDKTVTTLGGVAVNVGGMSEVVKVAASGEKNALNNGAALDGE